MVPANRCPVGNSHSAPATMPDVPMIVIAFGVTGVRASASPTGVSRRVRAGRSTFSMAVRILVVRVRSAMSRGSLRESSGGPGGPGVPAG